MTKTAMILAAGRGERLKPITDLIPKPMCLVQGIPLIEHHVIALAKAKYSRIIINHAYLGGLIRRHLGNGQRFGVEIIYVPEPPGALETGGGLFNALPIVGCQPFLVVNSDIYTDFDFSQLKLEQVNSMHLVLVPKDKTRVHHGDFSIHGGYLTNTPLDYTFSGIACYHPQVFAHCQPGRYSVVALMRNQAQNKSATAELYKGRWHDIGSLVGLSAANKQLY